MDFEGRLDLTSAVRERDELRRRYEEVVGSETELEAFVDLNAADLRVKALDRAERKLGAFYTEMERVAVELGNIRGQLLSVSAASETERQRELAAGVRDLREQVGAVAEGMAEVLESAPGGAPT